MSFNIFALTESDYVNQYCKGTIEYRLPDKTRIDCLTDTHAWEYDYSNKWAEAIGQSLHYSIMTGKKSGIVLICRGACDKHYKNVERINKEYGLSIDIKILNLFPK